MLALTIWNWVIVGLIAIAAVGFAIALFVTDEPLKGVIVLLVGIILCVITIVGVSWYHNNTASGARAMKDYYSEMNNGVLREITITAEDGREIFHYEGKIDIETSHENSENYILFESEEGLRYIIYYGVQDTVLIIEKEG